MYWILQIKNLLIEFIVQVSMRIGLALLISAFPGIIFGSLFGIYEGLLYLDVPDKISCFIAIITSMFIAFVLTKLGDKYL